MDATFFWKNGMDTAQNNAFNDFKVPQNKFIKLGLSINLVLAQVTSNYLTLNHINKFTLYFLL